MERRGKTYTALALTTCLITGLTACGELPISNPLNGSEQSGSTENPGQESVEKYRSGTDTTTLMILLQSACTLT